MELRRFHVSTDDVSGLAFWLLLLLAVLASVISGLFRGVFDSILIGVVFLAVELLITLFRTTRELVHQNAAIDSEFRTAYVARSVPSAAPLLEDIAEALGYLHDHQARDAGRLRPFANEAVRQLEDTAAQIGQLRDGTLHFPEQTKDLDPIEQLLRHRLQDPTLRTICATTSQGLDPHRWSDDSSYWPTNEQLLRDKKRHVTLRRVFIYDAQTDGMPDAEQQATMRRQAACGVDVLPVAKDQLQGYASYHPFDFIIFDGRCVAYFKFAADATPIGGLCSVVASEVRTNLDRFNALARLAERDRFYDKVHRELNAAPVAPSPSGLVRAVPRAG